MKFDENAVNIDWDALTFDVYPTRSMFFATCEEDGEWKEGSLIPFGPIEMSPAAGALNYGQGVFEGTKAYRTAKDRVVLFRPQMNAKRMVNSARRLCIPPPSEDFFMNAVVQTVRDNIAYVPPLGKGSLYIRPIVWGTGAVLGVKPAPSYTFIVYVSPVGPYFKHGVKPLHLTVTREYHRAAPKGIGNAKAIGNYSASLYPLKLAKEKAYDEVIYLNATDDHHVEEVGSANLFALIGNTLKTPRLAGSILPGITRDSVLTLAKEELHLDTQETDLTIEELLQADEAFCTGTAVVVTPIGKITLEDKTYTIQSGEIGPVTAKLRSMLLDIQRERREDPFGWVYPLT